GQTAQCQTMSFARERWAVLAQGLELRSGAATVVAPAAARTANTLGEPLDVAGRLVLRRAVFGHQVVELGVAGTAGVVARLKQAGLGGVAGRVAGAHVAAFAMLAGAFPHPTSQ